jgi:ElaB/YqjD/DUF883 family membrane-anchored ribosome-binding protein
MSNFKSEIEKAISEKKRRLNELSGDYNYHTGKAETLDKAIKEIKDIIRNYEKVLETSTDE